MLLADWHRRAGEIGEAVRRLDGLEGREAAKVRRRIDDKAPEREALREAEQRRSKRGDLGSACEHVLAEARAGHEKAAERLARALRVEPRGAPRLRNARKRAPLSHRGAIRWRTGSAALDLAYVAAGRSDGFWRVGLHKWDLAAGMLLVREAGGLMSAPDGGEDFMGRGEIVATNRRLFRETLRCFQS